MVNGWLHRCPVVFKVTALMLSTLLSYAFDSIATALLLLLAAILIIKSVPGVWLRLMTISRPIFWMLIGVFLVYLATDRTTDGAGVVIRSFALFSLAMMVSLTSKWTELLQLLEFVLKPFRCIGLPTDSIALTVALVFRFIPQLLDRWARLNECWHARSPRLSGLKLLAPSCLQALFLAERADECLRARMPRKP